MKICITNNLKSYSKQFNSKGYLICNTQEEFNNLGFNAATIEEYIFTDSDTQHNITIPKNIFKLTKKCKHNNLLINTYKLDKKILNGKGVSNTILGEIKQQLNQYKLDNHQLVVIQVGNDVASGIYINNKLKIANNLNIPAKHLKLAENISQEDLINEINKLNKDKNVTAILVQLPLPHHIDENVVVSNIDVNKDIDCLHPYNVGKVLQSKSDDLLFPCTPIGCIKLLEAYSINLQGKHVVIVGRSNIVGKPLMAMCLNRDATVSICHSKTKNLSSITKNADILISAIGSPNFFDQKYIKKNCICVDVGINRQNNMICGDINFKDVYSKVKYITPVPYGVGPMTLCMLFANFLTLVKHKNNE